MVYVTDGEVNASIPKGADPATLSLEMRGRCSKRVAALRRRRAAAVAPRSAQAAATRRDRSSVPPVGR